MAKRETEYFQVIEELACGHKQEIRTTTHPYGFSARECKAFFPFGGVATTCHICDDEKSRNQPIHLEKVTAYTFRLISDRTAERVEQRSNEMRQSLLGMKTLKAQIHAIRLLVEIK